MKFECKDMGTDCDYVATAETQAEVLAMVMAHAVDDHSELFTGLSTEQTEEINAKFASLITADSAEEIVAEDLSGSDAINAADDDDTQELLAENALGEDEESEDEESEDEEIEEEETEEDEREEKDIEVV